MRKAIYILLILSIIGIAYEITLRTNPQWRTKPVVATLTDLDPTTRTGTFRFPEESGLPPLYIQMNDPEDSEKKTDNLIVQEGAEKTRISALPGKVIRVGETQLKIDTIRPWVGILPDPQGQPYLSLSIKTKDGTWAENILIGTNTQITIENHQLQLTPLRNQNADEFLQAQSPGRWGVQEGDNTHWFENLILGSGLEVDNGTQYTLLQFREKHKTKNGTFPAIAVQIENEGKKENQIITTHTQNSPIKLEYHTTPRIWFLITPDNTITAAVLLPDQTTQLQTIFPEKEITISSTPLTIRIEQYEAKGIPVSIEQTPFQEVLLTNDTRRVRIRQGEAIRVGDALIRYERALDLETIPYKIATHPQMNASQTLEPTKTITLNLNNTPHKLTHKDINSDQTVTLQPQPKTNPIRLAILVVTFLLTLAALIRKTKTLSSPPHNSL